MLSLSLSLLLGSYGLSQGRRILLQPRTFRNWKGIVSLVDGSQMVKDKNEGATSFSGQESSGWSLEVATTCLLVIWVQPQKYAKKGD